MKTTDGDSVALLYEVQKSDRLIGSYGLLRAVAQCLSIEDSLAILRKESSRASELRDAVLRRLTQGQEVEASQFDELISSLVSQLEGADARARQGLSYCLSTLFPSLTSQAQRLTLCTLLTHRSIVLRRRAYRLWEHQEILGSSDLLTAWSATRDPECAWLLIKVLPADQIAQMRIDLLSVLPESWQVSRAYLRMAERGDELLAELATRDGISYAYVLAKLGKSMSDSQAREIVSRYEADDRLGLLVWALGKMKLEATLRWLAGELPKIEERKLATLRARYDA